MKKSFILLAIWAVGMAAHATNVSYSGCCNVCHSGCCPAFVCYLTNGDMASSNDVQTMQNNVNDAITTFGESVTLSVQKTTAAMNAALDAYSKEMLAMMQQMVAAWMAARYTNEATGPAGSMYQACMDAGTSARTAILSIGAMRQAWQQAQQQRNTSLLNTQQKILQVAQMPPSTLSANHLFAPSSAASSAQATQNYINLLTNPIPADRLPKALTSTPSGVQWSAWNHAEINKIGLAQQVLDDIASSRMPPQPGASSAQAVLEHEATYRLTDAGWQAWAQTAGEAGLAKDIAKMGAVSLAQQLRSLDLLQNLTALSAQSYALRATLADTKPNASTAQASAQLIAP